MEALIKESLDSLFPVFRGLLRLKGIVPPIKKEDIARSLSDAFGVDYDTFIAVLKDEKNDEKIAGEELESFLIPQKNNMDVERILRPHLLKNHTSIKVLS